MLLKSGAASYLTSDSSGTSRWGDYSTTTVDPENPNHFWVIQEIPSRRSSWSTQVTELMLVSPTPAVSLGIAVTGNQALLSWPTNAPTYQLQFTPTLGPTNSWTTLTNTPTIVSNLFQATVPIQDAQGFFRLATPQ
jgi:hypothetical protein